MQTRILIVFLAFVFFANLSFASNAVIGYRSDSGSCIGSDVECPKVRFWNSTGAGSWGSEITLPSIGDPVKGIVVKWSPVSDKIVLVTVDDDGTLDGFVCMSNCQNASSWNFTSSIGTVPDPDDGITDLDIAFETSTGDAVLVYGVESSNASRDIAYKVLPAATSSWSGLPELYINDTSGGTDNVQYLWVRLDRDPVTTSQELALVGFETTNDDINAWIWNGTAFGNQVEISSSATEVNDRSALAVQYASDGSIAMALGGNGTSGNVNYRRWNGTAWTSVSSFDSSGTGSDDANWINLKDDPSTDDLMAVITADDEDLHTAYWNGSTWNVTDHIDSDIDTETTFTADFDWNPTGSTGKLVWDTDGSGSTLSVRTCAPKCNGSTTTISTYGDFGRWLSLHRNPTASDTVDILGIRLSDDFFGDEDLGSFTWNGTAFTNYGDSVISGDTDETDFRIYSLDFSTTSFANVSVLKLDQTTALLSSGGTAQFNLTITNTGNVSLNITVNDTLPSGLTFGSATGSPNVSGQNVVWNFNLTPGNSTVLYLNATVNPGVANASNTTVIVTNCVNATGVPASGSNVSSASCAPVTVYYANVSAVKLDMTAAQASPGGLVQFNITVTNTGNVTLSPVEVEDDFPTELTLVSTSPAYDDFDGFELDWFDVGPLAPGASKVIYINATVNPGVVNAGTPQLNLTNCAEAVGTPPNGDDVFSEESCVNVTVYYANVSVVKVDMTPIVPISQGGMVTWQVNISNPGEVTLNPVKVVDTLPSELSFSSSSPAADSAVGQTITWNNVGPIAPGGSVLIILNSTVNLNTTNGTYTNNITVTGVPPNGNNVSDSDSATVSTYTAAINVVKTGFPGTVVVGANEQFSVNITNTGQVNLTVTVVDLLPANVNFVSSPDAPTSNASGTVTWSGLVTLSPGSSYVLLYNVTPNQTGNYTNNVTGIGVPPNGANVSDSDSAFFIAIADGDNDDEDENELSISVSSDCNSNVVTVTGSGPVSGATVKVDGDVIGTTNSSGQVSFTGCGNEVTVRASKSGYSDAVEDVQLDSCSCLPPECEVDADCEANEMCTSELQCEEVPCECGSIQNHQCVSYQCCSDSDCPSGEQCEGNQCVPEFDCDLNGPGPEDDNDDCSATEYCDVLPGQSGGTCKDVTGLCGYVSNHAWVQYECGPEAGCTACPVDHICSNRKCVLRDVNCPSTGIVGDEVTCTATEEGEPCSGCPYKVVSPSGSSTTGTTDENGNFQLPLGLEGTYMVSLLLGGNTSKIVQVKALLSPESVFPEKPTITTDYLPCLVILLVVLLILGVLWWRRRQEKEPPKKGKK
jgi:uncharacterized repeat protein (TIGR01451 family)